MPEPEPIVETSAVLRPQIEFDDDAAIAAARIAPPVREGLPPGFRMRADAHYVDQLDTRMSSIPVRLIDTQSIEAGQQNGDAVSQAFVDSVKRHGIIQPLLVAAQGSRYRVIAGRRRLAAAISAGLRDVPCLVQHVDTEEADHLALASNLPATRPRPPIVQAGGGVNTASASNELASTLAAIVSCANLLTSGSPVSQGAAVNLVRAEAARALEMLMAMRVLRDELPMARARIRVTTILETVQRMGAVERDVRGVHLAIEDSSATAGRAAVTADPKVIAATVNSLVGIAAAIIESMDGSCTPASDDMPVRAQVALGVALNRQGIVFCISQEHVALPAAWVARPFEIAWPVRAGAASLVRLQAARKVAQIHGGDLEIEGGDTGTTFKLHLPLTPD